jgi:hypothetical protein
MKASVDFPESQPANRSAGKWQETDREAILLELGRILASPFFKSAARSTQFLTYVVHRQLDGHAELLKERTIGTEVFHRPSDYATGDDPVVRVQAGEVRRRLNQYYQSAPEDCHIRIELPVGSYSPAFHMGAAVTANHVTQVVQPPATTPEPHRQERRPTRRWVIANICAVLAIAAVAVTLTIHRSARRDSVLAQFWAPVFATQQPALICLAKGVTYRPSQDLYEKYAKTHAGVANIEVERANKPLPLDPNKEIKWGDLQLLDGYGVAIGDVSAAVKLSALLGKIGKTNQLRIGANYSFEDLRNSPAVVVGAFNNKWTMDMMSNLHFAFLENGRKLEIREQTPGGRSWETQFDKSDVALVKDYGIVARLLDSKTGQFTIIVAGIRDSGTQAAGEFASSEEELAGALKNAPAGWQTKNAEFVLETTVTDTISGPPAVLASYYW